MNSDNESSNSFGMKTNPTKTGIFSTPSDSNSSRNLNSSALGSTNISTANLPNAHNISDTQAPTNPTSSLNTTSSSASQSISSSLTSNQSNPTTTHSNSSSLNPFSSSSILPQNSNNQNNLVSFSDHTASISSSNHSNLILSNNDKTPISSSNSDSNATQISTSIQPTSSSKNIQTGSSSPQGQPEATPSPNISSGKLQTSSNTFLSNSKRPASSIRKGFSGSSISSVSPDFLHLSTPTLPSKKSFFTKGRVLVVLAIVITTGIGFAVALMFGNQKAQDIAKPISADIKNIGPGNLYIKLQKDDKTEYKLIDTKNNILDVDKEKFNNQNSISPQFTPLSCARVVYYNRESDRRSCSEQSQLAVFDDNFYKSLHYSLHDLFDNQLAEGNIRLNFKNSTISNNRNFIIVNLRYSKDRSEDFLLELRDGILIKVASFNLTSISDVYSKEEKI